MSRTYGGHGSDPGLWDISRLSGACAMCGTWGAWDDTSVVVVLSDCSVPGTVDHTVAVTCSCVQGLTGYQVGCSA